MPGSERECEVIEVTDRLIKKTSLEDFMTVWNVSVIGKGLTFYFFSEPLVRKDIVVTA
jgi:hypothetical protein